MAEVRLKWIGTRISYFLKGSVIGFNIDDGLTLFYQRHRHFGEKHLTEKGYDKRQICVSPRHRTRHIGLMR